MASVIRTDSAEIADAWYQEYDVQPPKKNNFNRSDTRSLPEDIS